MKLKSYNILFRIFSFLSDKTNGAPLFVKYKLLLGTTIIGLIGPSAKASNKETIFDTIPFRPLPAEITCYKVAVIPTRQQSDSVEIKSNVKYESGEAVVGASVRLKKEPQIGVLTDLDGNFTLKANVNDTLVVSFIGLVTKEIPVFEINNNTIIELKNDLDNVLSCYVIIVPDIYSRKKTLIETDIRGHIKDKNGEELPYTSISVKNSNQSTYSDVDGNFSIKAKPDDILVFSFLGYDKQEIPVSEIKDGKIAVTMEENNTIMCYEVVVIPTPGISDKYKCIQRNLPKLAYNEVDTAPVSPVGDIRNFENWVQKNIKYNEQMQKDKVQGQVILSFAVDKKGKLVDKKVIAKLSKEADQEALRVLSSSEKWKPGVYKNKPIKTTITITVNFNAQ